MRSTVMLIAASAALVSSQATLNSTTGKWECSLPDVAFCSTDSMKTDIIIRCDANKVGQPGRCSDNLDGEPPVGDFPALCYQPDATSGTAACEKNCVVYGASGNGNGTFTLPLDICKPTYSATTSTPSQTSYPTSTGFTSIPSASSTFVPTTVVPPLSTATSGSKPASGNGTCTSCSGGSSGGGNGSGTTIPTNTPKGPTQTTGTGGPSTIPTAGATVNRVGGSVAALGLLAVYFL